MQARQEAKFRLNIIVRTGTRSEIIFPLWPRGLNSHGLDRRLTNVEGHVVDAVFA